MITSKTLQIAGVCLLMATVALTGGCKKKNKGADAARGSFPDSTMTTNTDAMNSEKTGGQWKPTDSTTGAPAETGAIGTNDAVIGGHSGSAPGAMKGTKGAKDIAGGVPQNAGGETGQAGAPVPDLATVYFDYDKFDLTASTKTALDKNATYLSEHADLKVVLRGHTDEQGTEEYNISLGQRRADTVRDYLVEKGIDAARLDTISFGESLKAVEAEDDASRAQNRRVEFFVYN